LVFALTQHFPFGFEAVWQLKSNAEPKTIQKLLQHADEQGMRGSGAQA